MSILNLDNGIILMIDIQDKLLNAAFDKEKVEKKAGTIIRAASILNIPVIATEQYPQGLGSTVQSIKYCMPSDRRKSSKR